MNIRCNNLNDTIAIATTIANSLSGSDIVLLSGDLGAGKTTFTKAVAKAIGITATVTSPTFAFMKEYQGRIKLYHYDMYRIESADEIEELGIGEHLYEDALCIIEWNKYTHFPHDKRVIRIDITKDIDDINVRIISIIGMEARE